MAHNTVVVGAPLDTCDTGGPACGAAYVYRFDGLAWLETDKLEASDASDHDEFGWSLAMTEEIAVAGTYHAGCPSGTDCGAAYVYAIGPDSDGDGVADPCDRCPGYDDAGTCPIPTVSVWGIIALTLLVLAAGTIMLLRSRGAATSKPVA